MRYVFGLSTQAVFHHDCQISAFSQLQLLDIIFQSVWKEGENDCLFLVSKPHHLQNGSYKKYFWDTMKNVVNSIMKSLDDAVGHHLNAEYNP